jgi:hypothetical protein
MHLWKVSLILCLTACLTVSMRNQNGFSAKEAEVWKSEDPVFGILSSLVIDKGKTRLSAFEACGSEECSWGWTQLEATAGGYTATYQEGRLFYKLYVMEAGPDQIQLFITSSMDNEDATLLSLAKFHREK